MAILFSGIVVVLGGTQTANTLAIAGNLKQVGIEQAVRLSMDSGVFPLGITTVTVGLSLDNGNTFKVASMTCDGSVVPTGGRWFLTYSLGSNDQPTHVKVTVDSAIGFSVNTTIEVL